jgi:hypothetical protein
LALAFFGLAAFSLHTYFKVQEGLLPELLWGCNVSAVALILGFAFEWDRVVGAAFLWRLVLGEPGFLLGVGSGERYGWTTGFVHLVPTLLAFIYLRRSGLPKGSGAWAAVGSLLLILVSHAWSPPDLNVNYAHYRVPLLSAWFPGRWSYRVVSAFLIAGSLVGAEFLTRRWLKGAGGRLGGP